MDNIMTKEKKLSAYTLESKKINVLDFKKQIRIALLSSFTLDGLSERIKVKGAEINMSRS